MSGPKTEPSEEFLAKIEEIGEIKRDLALVYRALSSSPGLYVQSGRLAGGGVQYMAGGRQWRADLTFEARGDGSYSVKRYKPGDWEGKVDETLTLCRCLNRAQKVPQGWPDDKRRAYEVTLPADRELVAEVQKQFECHMSEIDSVYTAISPDERGRLARVYWEELEKEWPIEHLEILLFRKGRPDSFLETTFRAVLSAYMYGNMVGKGWITRAHTAEACMDLGQGLAATANARRRGSRCRGTGFATALVIVSAEGAARAALDRQRATEFGEDQETNPLRISEPPEGLLRKIEYIADLKREISGEYNRSLIRVCGVFVDSRTLHDGAMLYAASGGEGHPSLVFERLQDGSRKVRVYQAGDWERGIDDTVALTRCLARIERIPEEWTDEKRATYEDTLPIDRVLLADLGEQRKRHEKDFDSVLMGTSEEEWMRLVDVYLDELAREWPIEHLDILLSGFKDVYGRPELKSEFPIECLETQDGPDLLTKMSLLAVQAAFVYGYMCGRGWITCIHMAAGCMDLGRGVAKTAWVRRTRSKCKGTGFGGGLLMVAAEGQVLAANEKSSR